MVPFFGFYYGNLRVIRSILRPFIEQLEVEIKRNFFNFL